MGDVLKTSQKVRDSRYELIRIVAMLLIIASHCVKLTFGSNYEFLKEAPSFNYGVALFAIMFGNVGTYLFIILTCWFSVGKVSFKASKVLYMVWQTWTTCVLCTAIRFLFKRPLNIITVLRELITPFDTQYWFVTTMIVFLFFLPVLQFLDAKLDNNKIRIICILMIIFRPIRVILSDALIGDLGDFITVFFVVSYLKRNPDNWLKKHSKLVIFAFTFFVVLLFVFRLILPNRLFGLIIFDDNGGLYRSIVARLRLRTFLQLLCAICVFYVMTNIKIKPNRHINSASQLSFGVYLWHYNYATRHIIWDDIFHASYFYSETNYYIFVILFAPVIVYIFCAAVEFIRSKILDEWLYNILPWNQKFESIFDKFYDWRGYM